eukprot:gene6319-11746_t
MSANVYKSLLFILSVSQMLVLVMFWKQMFAPETTEQRRRLETRAACDCTRGSSAVDSHSKRFENINSNESNENVGSIEFSNRLDDASQSEAINKTRQAESKATEESKPILLVAIITARPYKERRRAVRETWLQDCDPESNVICRFFTDSQDNKGDPIDQESLDELYEESAANRGDLVLLNSPSGTNFSLRLLALFEWAKSNLKFDFLLRIDDDHFLCLDRLLKELPFRPKTRLYWGHLHCNEGIVRIDEGMMILTADLIEEFLRNREKLMCHKYGDQAVAMWVYNSMKKKPVTWFGDPRVHHDPPASFLYEFKRREEICHTFISLHGSYPTDMRDFQKVIERERRQLGADYTVPPVADFCPYRRDYFNWQSLRGQFYAKPVPCKDEPIWVTKMTEYQGRMSYYNFQEMAKPTQVVEIQSVDLQYAGDSQKQNEAHHDASNDVKNHDGGNGATQNFTNRRT